MDSKDHLLREAHFQSHALLYFHLRSRVNILQGSNPFLAEWSVNIFHSFETGIANAISSFK